MMIFPTFSSLLLKHLRSNCPEIPFLADYLPAKLVTEGLILTQDKITDTSCLGSSRATHDLSFTILKPALSTDLNSADVIYQTARTVLTTCENWQPANQAFTVQRVRFRSLQVTSNFEKHRLYSGKMELSFFLCAT